MVYSSSAMRGYVSEDDPFAIVGPQILWAVLGIVAMLVDDADRLPLPAARVGAVPRRRRSLLLVLVFVPEPRASSSAARRAGSSSVRCRPSTRPRSPSSRWSSTSPTGWPGAARKVRGFWGGTAAVPAHRWRRSSRSSSWSPTWARPAVITLTAFTMFFVAGASLCHLGALGSAGPRWPPSRSACATTSWSASGPSSTRGRTRWATASTPSRACSRWRSAGSPGVGSAQSLGGSPAERLERLHLRDDRPGVRAHRGGRRHRPVRPPRLPGGARRARRARHVRRPARGRHHRLAVHPGVHQHRGRRRLLPVTGITLPFLSAGGSSLLVSFAAVGILLSISRETHRKGDVERRCDS